MRNIKQNIKFIWKSCILMMILVITSVVPVYAQEGAINIALQDLGGTSNMQNVQFRLYKVGTVSESAIPTLDDYYKISPYPQTAAELIEATKKIAADNQGTLIAEKTTDAEGRLSFQSLDNGVYLVVTSEAEKYGEVSPILVNIPYYEELEGVMTGPNYIANVEPKAVSSELTMPPEKPNTPEEPGTSEVPKTPTNLTQKPTVGIVKTGDTTDIAKWLFLGMIALFFGVTLQMASVHKKQKCQKSYTEE